jgi:predicted glycogen debranching enzyme
MAYIKFNKSELVNLSYSLKREIILANKTGAYCNTSIVTCNTRRYHGLLAVPVDAFEGKVHMLLSSLDESLELRGKKFNLGIHRYGNIYEPRGHKYIVDFDADPVTKVVYRVGEICFTKTILLVPDSDRVMIRFDLLESPAKLKLTLKPFLAFRDIHALTSENPEARTEGWEIPNGMAFNLYEGFPDLNMQFNRKDVKFISNPSWYKNITYSDEARRGFPCHEDLFVPGDFEVEMKVGDSIIFSAGVEPDTVSTMKRKFEKIVSETAFISSSQDILRHWAELFKRNRGHHKMVTAGFSWLGTGLLRETMFSLPGLTLCANGSKEEFEEILDNLIEDNQARFFRKTTQVEAPLFIGPLLERYIEFGADAKAVWSKYGETVKGVLESYLPGRRDEVAMQPNGLLWAQKDRTALTWMNAYIDGNPVTERAGYQVETNAFWYESIRFALEMEERYGSNKGSFVKEFSEIADLVKNSYQNTFWNEAAGYLADYVDNSGQHLEVRPNMLFAICGKYPLVDDEIADKCLNIITKELVTSRGIRTLSPRHGEYKAVYEGSQRERDLSYHNGSTRPALLAPYVEVCLKFGGESFLSRAEWLVKGFYQDLNKHGVGAFAELYDGDPPHEPHGAISSALSTSALLYVDYLIAKNKEDRK